LDVVDAVANVADAPEAHLIEFTAEGELLPLAHSAESDRLLMDQLTLEEAHQQERQVEACAFGSREIERQIADRRVEVQVRRERPTVEAEE
jgi:hypothetical protein